MPAEGVRERPIVVALDVAALDEALVLADALDASRCRLKVGQELFTRAGPEAVRALRERGFEVFLDLKFHDIPNTVAGACRSAAAMGAWMVTVHASGGTRMVAAAAEALAAYGPDRPWLVAVTMLTSLGAEDVRELGWERSAGEVAGQMADLALAAGADGLVCSPEEVGAMRARLGAEPLLVTPGIRRDAEDAQDQRRVATPHAALAAGASHLVIGRSISAAAEPSAALDAILSDIA